MKHVDSARFPFLVVKCSVFLFNMEIEFDVGENVLVNRRMKVCYSETKFSKGRFHKILKVLNWVARSNSYDSSGI